MYLVALCLILALIYRFTHLNVDNASKYEQTAVIGVQNVDNISGMFTAKHANNMKVKRTLVFFLF